jgi:hypothetical protein
MPLCDPMLIAGHYSNVCFGWEVDIGSGGTFVEQAVELC